MKIEPKMLVSPSKESSDCYWL
uniref:Uncharacterized protein n=1 Tax=Rhizophora mucronata TaxID=61149 RepID=A0A2P2NB05_RHIMU